MPLNYVQPWKPPTNTAATQPISNRQWSTGQTAWDPKGMFGSNQQTGMVQNQQPNYKITMGAQPQAQFTADPTPQAQAPQDTQVATATPYSGGFTYQDKTPQNVDVSTPTPTGLVNNPAPYQPGPGVQGPQGNGLNTQYATLENIQPYMNPYLDQIINRGNNAIQQSAAARGGLQSSGTINDIGDWTSQATANEYNNATNRFNSDRGYMTDNYWKDRTANTSDYWDTYNANWDQYKYGNADYQGRLNDYYNANQGIVNQGINGANNTGSIYANLAQALAGLYGDQGNATAGGIMGSSAASRGMIGNILGMIFGGA